MLPRRARLARQRDFSAVYARRAACVHPLLILHLRRRPGGNGTSGSDDNENDKETARLETRRFGFSVSKKTARKAHDRNRIKRRLRAICRQCEQSRRWQGSFDAVWVVRSAALDADFQALEQAVGQLAREAGVSCEAAADTSESEEAVG